MNKTGILLINLGTPDDTSIKSIRRYLREFLLDPRVLDLPTLLRYLLVYGIILPFRPARTAKAYKKIWQPDGSPLRLHTEALETALAKQLGDDYCVVAAMRYGNPSIASALAKLSGCKKIIVLPLFPQYSSAATGSAIEHFFEQIKANWNLPEIQIIHEFYQAPVFINAYAETIKSHMPDTETYLLFSYHSLPERHLDKSHCQASCNRMSACPSMSSNNAFCYRAQCYRTSELIAQQLDLSAERYSTSFQSRLGRIPWIQPYTDKQLTALRKQGIKNIAVVCPAFVADCLETLEEIGIQAQEQWHELGGEKFTLLPCLNTDESWVNGLAHMLKQKN